VAKRKEKEDWVMECDNEKGKERLGDKLWQRERKRKTG
jgi:DNA polymerase IIIc chi subunit